MKDWIAGFAWGLTLCLFSQTMFWYGMGKPNAKPQGEPYIIEYHIPVTYDDIGLKHLTINDIQEML